MPVVAPGVTTPVLAPMLATAGTVLTHEPVDGVPVSVTEPELHAAEGPDIVGPAVTETTDVAKHAPVL